MASPEARSRRKGASVSQPTCSQEQRRIAPEQFVYKHVKRRRLFAGAPERSRGQGLSGNARRMGEMKAHPWAPTSGTGQLDGEPPPLPPPPPPIDFEDDHYFDDDDDEPSWWSTIRPVSAV